MNTAPGTTTSTHSSGDLQALGRFETFFVSAILTVVIVRSFLVATGYPRVGGGGLHVAHVLYGGLLMGVAIVIAQIHPGSRARRRSAVIGGIGFGLFIDEVGKFLTKNVNYFFRPAIAIIYAVFVVFFLVVREVILRRPQTDALKLAAAANAIGDLALGQLTEDHERDAIGLLDSVTSHPELAAAMRHALVSERCCTSRREARITDLRNKLADTARRAVAHEAFRSALAVVFALQIAGLAAEFAIVSLTGPKGAVNLVRIAAAVTTAVSALCGLFGAYRLARGNTAGAVRVLLGSVLVTLLLTQMFVFTTYQLTGALGLFFELVVWLALRVVVDANAHLHPRTTVTPWRTSALPASTAATA